MDPFLFPVGQTGIVEHRSSVFVPVVGDAPLVQQTDLSVPAGWVRLRRSVAVRDLHDIAAFDGMTDLLDVSGVGGFGYSSDLGVLRVPVDRLVVPLELAYCASLVFVGGGPFRDLCLADVAAARDDARLLSSGRLLGLASTADPDSVDLHATPAAWHAWLVARAVHASGFADRVVAAAGFTEVLAVPYRRTRPAAYGCAAYGALVRRSLLPLLSDYSAFSRYVSA